jgi:hypothetical protein
MVAPNPGGATRQKDSALGFWTLIGKAWRGAASGVQRHIPLFLGVLLIHCALNAISDHLAPPQALSADTATMNAAELQETLRFYIVSLTGNAAISVASIPCMVAIFRLLLVGEAGPVFRHRRAMLLMAAILIGMRVAVVISAAFAFVIGPFSAILVALTMVLYVRWLLAYPGLALGIASPIDTSFNLSKGHWWIIVATYCCGLLPVLAADAVTEYGLLATLQPHHPAAFFLLNAGSESVFGLASITLAAALGAELFRSLGGMRGRLVLNP